MKDTQDNSLPEITVKGVILGVVLAMVLAAANAYLGLFAGMTVSATIPAAVISMGVRRERGVKRIFQACSASRSRKPCLTLARR